MVKKSTNPSFNELYAMGCSYLDMGNYKVAKDIFKIFLENPDFRQSACNRLITIAISENNYQEVRKLVQEVEEARPEFYASSKAKLELREYNYQSSLALYEKLMQYPQRQNEALFGIANIQRALGEKQSARNLYALLQEDSEFSFQVLMELSGMDLEEENYKAVKQRLGKFSTRTLPSSQKVRVNNIKQLVDTKCKNENFQTNPFNANTQYALSRFFALDDGSLYRHLEKHMEGFNSKEYFLKYINMPALVDVVKEKMKIFNPYFTGVSNRYYIAMDSTIGFKVDTYTNHLCACTYAGSENILTMYPILLSKEFNKEGYLENKKVLEKRRGK